MGRTAGLAAALLVVLGLRPAAGQAPNREGISVADINLMAKTNPAIVLGLPS